MSQKEIFFPDLQETITRTCLTYMLFNDSSEVDTYDDSNLIPTLLDSVWVDCYLHIPRKYPHIPLARKYPFLSYSIYHWGYHASELQHPMEKEIVAFLDSVWCRNVRKILHTVIFSTEALIPLHFAVEYDLLHIAKVLLDRGDDPCQCEKPLLMTAIEKHNPEMMKLLLLQDNIDPNTQSSSFQLTPLSHAAMWESTQLVEILLQSDRVDVNCKDCRGRTPLMMAVSYGNLSMVELLLKHTRINILARDDDDNPAYSYAYWRGLRQRRLQQPDSSDNDRMIVLLEKYGGRPQPDYKPTYLMADGLLPNEQLNSNSGFRIPLDSSTTFPAEDLTGPPPCYDINGDPHLHRFCHLQKIRPSMQDRTSSIPCLVPHHNREMAYMGRYDLLPFNPRTMEFVRTSYGSIPGGSRPVEGGYEEDMTPLYHGIAVVDGIRLPGTIRRHQYVLQFVRHCN